MKIIMWFLSILMVVSLCHAQKLISPPDSSIIGDNRLSGSNLIKPFNIGNITAGKYSSFDQYGRYTAVGDSATEWGEIFVTPAAVKLNPVNTKPDYITWIFPGQTYSFDASAAESLYFHVEIPHDHKIGTSIHAHVHWAPSTTHNGNCAWKIAWMVQDLEDTFAFTASDTLSVRDTGDGTANKHQYADIGDISMAGVSNISAIMSGVLIRDAALGSDTFTGEAIFLDLGFHYEIDSFGSRWEMKK